MSVVEWLTACGSPDAGVRQPAEQQLVALRDGNFPAYVQGLAAALAGAQIGAPVRMMAGVQLKNVLDARDDQLKAQNHNRWMQLAAPLRTEVKNMALQLVMSEALAPVRRTASQLVGAIAEAELKHGQWPELLNALTTGAASGSVGGRQASLDALGYVCETCGDALQQHSNTVLNAIASGMGKNQDNDSIKLAATRALHHSLDFASANMNKRDERELIMMMVLQAAGSANVEVREAAIMCLCEIADLYYEHLPAHIEAIFMLTGTSIKQDEEQVKLQAIEFWNVIAETEIDLVEKAERGIEARNFRFVPNALPQLVPVILSQLPQTQDMPPDADEWNVQMAAGVCLGVLSSAAGDAIVGVVMPFVRQHITSEQWQMREAAVLAFGYILDGPDTTQLAHLGKLALPILLQYIDDPSATVKDTAVWTVARICQFLPACVDSDTLPQLMQFISKGLQDSPSVACHACFAVYNLANNVNVSDGAATSPLTPYFGQLVTMLFQLGTTTQSERLLTTSFSTIHVMITKAAADTLDVVIAMLPEVLNRLKAVNDQLAAQAAAAQGNTEQVQVQLTAVLQAIVEKMAPVRPEVVHGNADLAMTLVLQILGQPNSSAHEEAFMLSGSLAHACGANFSKYMEAFFAAVLAALNATDSVGVCAVATDLVGDLGRALEAQLVPVADELMKVLLKNLSDPNVDRSLKPRVIASIGDVAQAVRAQFDRYMPYVMPVFAQASMLHIPEPDLDDIDFLEELREAVLSAYTAIVQDAVGHNDAASFNPFLGGVVEFIRALSTLPQPTSGIVGKALGLAGDLLINVPESRRALKMAMLNPLMQHAQQSGEDDLVEAATWTRGLCQQAGIQ